MQALPLAVFAEVGDALVGGFARAAKADFAAGESYAFDAVRAQPEQALEQLGAAGADQAREAEDLARRDLEAHVARPARHRQALHLQQRRPVRSRVLHRVQIAEVAADHQVRHLPARDVRRQLARDEAAVAHHDDLIGDALNLVELVRDVDQRDAVGLQLRDQCEQALGLARRERRGRLVHDQQARLALQRLRDLDQLLLGDDQMLDQRVGACRQADQSQHAFGLGAHRSVVEPRARPAARRARTGVRSTKEPHQTARLLVAEEDVLRDGQVLGERELLVDHHDAARLGCPWSIEVHHVAIDTQFAAAQGFIAGEDLHQRALAGAVLAEQADHATGCEVEADTVQDLHRAERLLDLVKRHCRAHAATFPRPRSVSCIASTPAPIKPAWSPSGEYRISRCRVDNASER